jgi:hypothetical protein
MGISLDGRSIDWDQLYRSIKSGQVKPAFDAEFRQMWGPRRDMDAAWTESIAELQSNVDDPAEEFYPELTESAQIAFTAIVRHYGQLCGTLTHNSLAGKRFRGDFLDTVATRIFKVEALSEWLTDRPFRGLAGFEFPAWGGIARDEISLLLSNYEPPPNSIEPEFIGWIEDLHEMLVNGRKRAVDLITLYY